MQTNELPYMDTSDNPTGYCPRFNPEGWDGQELHFDHKKFLRAETRSLFYFPLNFGKVFGRVQSKIEESGANSNGEYFVLSHDESKFRAEHLFAVTKDVEGEEMVELSGHFLTKVFEGPYKEIPNWAKEMEQCARDRGKNDTNVRFFYTTCPKCARTYGKNYVVGVVEV